ncbi:MAG: hypothetical protein F9K13_06945 [Candidatus Methylomirabilis oxygeniifera]|uniref:RiboL-PSP-HEPN domain-containing protein n=1 Tax=Methylomirabilis oxygeniifera TaxID=671143 RepID=D5MH71_METO1|nr:MAG: hypothetical protein F9K13_06945 [Candidatus Methylomirabilis oxyfera]CBE69103.1 protein of unknown function [Candidatus Methylomirabilis oxyfera]
MIEATALQALRDEKLIRLQALQGCDRFVAHATSEAAWDPFSFSFFGNLRSAADAIPADFEELDKRPGVKVQDRRVQPYIRSQLFIALVSELEDFLKSVLTVVIMAYPGKIGSEQVTVEVVAQLGRDGALRFAAEKHLNQLFYETPLDYGKKIAKLLSMSEELFLSVWSPIVEMKARRDIGVHNGWVRNDIYDRRITAVGAALPSMTFLGASDTYFEGALKASAALLNIVTDHCVTKFSVDQKN